MQTLVLTEVLRNCSFNEILADEYNQPYTAVWQLAKSVGKILAKRPKCELLIRILRKILEEIL
ncbi:MAG: hypothetical protein CWE10_08965 [Symbiobacterium thermophilum]|uniref:Uncharacterized protein n=1 Tax=Symbiobacterium thermophilum TaxID=2734 RepID=A0A953IBJ8_SYMTR|nr:hypothetical protein [Symbiobacterium thermophilum]